MRRVAWVFLLGLLMTVSQSARADAARRETAVQSGAQEIGMGIKEPAPHARGADSSARVINVTGYALVRAKPDEMILSFDVNSQASTADKVTRAQSAKTNKIVDALKASAGAGAQIHTADFSMSQQPVAIRGGVVQSPPEPRRTYLFTAWITGYADSLAGIGKLIDAGMAAGANGIGGSGFDVEPGLFTMSSAATSEVVPNRTSSSGSALRVHAPPPERPYISMNVKLVCSNASRCVSRGARMVDRVKRAMADASGNKRAVRLSNFQLTEVGNQGVYRGAYAYRSRPQYATRQEFNARATVTVETKHLQKLGELIRAGIGAGADRLNNVQFTLGNDSAARNDAIARAAADAKSKAQVLAKSMGVRLGEVISISTNAIVRPQTIYGASLSLMEHREAAAMQVLPRNVGFSATVNATYAIR